MHDFVIRFARTKSAQNPAYELPVFPFLRSLLAPSPHAGAEHYSFLDPAPFAAQMMGIAKS